MKGKIVSVWANKRVSLIPLALRRLIKRLAEPRRSFRCAFARLMLFTREIMHRKRLLFRSNLAVRCAERVGESVK